VVGLTVDDLDLPQGTAVIRFREYLAVPVAMVR
jgi:hypothetical protein